jgi:hypothetical protein
MPESGRAPESSGTISGMASPTMAAVRNRIWVNLGFIDFKIG